MEEFHGRLNALMATALGSRLNDPVVLASSLDHPAAFANIVAHRLFDINVFAGLTGPDRTKSVPVVWSGE